MRESKQARKHDDLIDELLDSRTAKTEREHAAAREIERLRRDKQRIDWLADTKTVTGNVQLPRDCVERNIHDMRAAIDDAMQLEFLGRVDQSPAT